MIDDFGVAHGAHRSTVGVTHVLGRAAAAARHAWPMWILAISLNGFFLYLAAFDALAIRTTSASTAAYYVALSACLLAAAMKRRLILADRLRRRRRLAMAWIASAIVLATWFVVNAALFSDGPLARNLVALFLLWTIPTALVALSLRLDDIAAVAHGFLGLALVFIALETAAIRTADGDVFRFTPISNLDPISAGLIPALGAVAALSLRPHSMPGRIAQFAVTAILVAGSVVPGSRGPVLALLAAALVMTLTQPRPLRAALPVAVAVGLAGGLTVSSHVGSLGYMTSALSAEPPTPPAAAPQAPSAAGCEGGEPVAATDVLPPDRLSVDAHATHADVTRRTARRLTLAIHVSCRGKDVDGALVLARVVSGGVYSEPAESVTDAHGWAWITLRELMPSAERESHSVVFARARRSGEDVLAGVTAVRELTVSFAPQEGSEQKSDAAGTVKRTALGLNANGHEIVEWGLTRSHLA